MLENDLAEAIVDDCLPTELVISGQNPHSWLGNRRLRQAFSQF